MNLMLWLYLVNVAESLKVYFGFGVILGLIITIFTLITGPDCAGDEKYGPYWIKWMIGGGSMFILSTFVYLALPDNQTMYLMMGAKTAEEVVTNPAVKKIGARVMSIIDKKLNEMSGGAPDSKKEAGE